MLRLPLIALLFVLVAGAPGLARGHAVLLETSPADGAALAEAPGAITLRFNEPVRPITVRVLDAGRQAEVEPAALETADGLVRVRLEAPLPPGSYVVTYRVMSADAHPVGGAFVFTIGPTSDPPSPGLAAAPFAHDAAWHVATTAVRALWYGHLLLAAGFALFLVLIPASEELHARLRRTLVWLAPAGVAAGALALGVAGGALLGESALSLLSLRPWLIAAGTPLAASAGTAGLGLVVLALAARRGGRAPLLAGALLVALSFALSGHALTAGPRWLVAPLIALHGLLTAFWVGALWPLLQTVRQAPGAQAAATLAAFSRLAVPAVVALVLAGTVLALVQLRSPSDLIATGYGQRLALKLALVAGLLALAGANRYLLTPWLASDRARSALWLRRTLGADLALAAGVVVLTASLSLTPPPGALPEAHDHDQHAAREDYAVQAAAPGGQLLLVVAPARIGPNRIDLHLMDGAGQPLDALEAELRLSLPEQEIEALRAGAERLSPGRFVAREVALPLAGTWLARADLLVDDFTKLTFQVRVEIRR